MRAPSRRTSLRRCAWKQLAWPGSVGRVGSGRRRSSSEASRQRVDASNRVHVADGKVGSLVDALGHFYKPMQDEVRGAREVQFYEDLCKWIDSNCQDEVERESEVNEAVDDHVRSAMSALASVVPRYYGTCVLHGDLGLKRRHIKLEDLTRKYENPSIVDIKVGYRTWYPDADEKYKTKCRAKDAATTSSTLGFKICGMQVYNAVKQRHWRADRNWCKQVNGESIHVALAAFGNNGLAATPEGIYLGKDGVLNQLRKLKDIFKIQKDFLFHSTSILILYEGAATTVEDLRVTLKLVDFAHTFHADCTLDTNFLTGLSGLEQVIESMFFG